MSSTPCRGRISSPSLTTSPFGVTENERLRQAPLPPAAGDGSRPNPGVASQSPAPPTTAAGELPVGWRDRRLGTDNAGSTPPTEGTQPPECRLPPQASVGSCNQPSIHQEFLPPARACRHIVYTFCRAGRRPKCLCDVLATRFDTPSLTLWCVSISSTQTTCAGFFFENCLVSDSCDICTFIRQKMIECAKSSRILFCFV